jgi:uncharacterized membrane protein YhaH (DUF805 family)
MARLLWCFGSFTGRLPRKTFWAAAVALWLTFAVLFVFIEHAIGHAATLVLYPFFFWGAAAVATKRLHDRGQSAWRLLLALIPILGPVYLLIDLGLLLGTRGDNQYGPDPLEAGLDYLTVAVSR